MFAAPLENHWINIADDKVESISRRPAYALSRHLGEHSIVLPATVNAHAHLELSQLSQTLNVPSRSMSDWIAALLAFRRSADYDAKQGIRQALHRPEFVEATGAVADIIPFEMANGKRLTANETIKYLPFTELIAWRNNKEHETLVSRYSFGLSPHAPHTVCPALLEKAVNQQVPLAMHLAETLEEIELLRYHTGSFLEMMRRADPDYDPKSVLLGKRPMDYLQLLSAAPKSFIIHGNYLDEEELRFLAVHRETMSVVYCPRSHAYFQHKTYPLQKMLDFGVRVLLGTDSLASTPDLSLIAEMEFVQYRYPALLPEIIYRLGTVEGATAFDLLQEGLGTIQSGSPARFAIANGQDSISALP